MHNICIVCDDNYVAEGLKALLTSQPDYNNNINISFFLPDDAKQLLVLNEITVIHYLHGRSCLAGFYRTMSLFDRCREVYEQIVICAALHSVIEHFTSFTNGVLVIDAKSGVTEIAGRINLKPKRRSQKLIIKKENDLMGITKKQLDVIIRLARGRTVDSISRSCNINRKTVCAHKRNLLMRLNITTRFDYYRVINLLREVYRL